MDATLRTEFSTSNPARVQPSSGRNNMIRKISILIVALVAVVMFAASAQASSVTIDKKKRSIKVSYNPDTDTVVQSSSGGYNRTLLVSRVERKLVDGSIEVYETMTTAKIRIKKCPKRAKRCVNDAMKIGPRRLVRIIPAPQEQVATPMPAPDGESLPSRIYSVPTLSCDFPPAWIYPPPPNGSYIPYGTISCRAVHDEDDPVVSIVAVSPDAVVSNFVDSEYVRDYQQACTPPGSCHRAIYDLGTTPGEYGFQVTATTKSGQVATYTGNALISEGYPTDSYKSFRASETTTTPAT